MSLDHGLLNVPLAKRGNIDAQLDAYKAKQAREAGAKAKSAAAETRRLRGEAKALVEAADTALLTGVAKRTGKTVAQVRSHLQSEAHWNPAWVIRALGGAA